MTIAGNFSTWCGYYLTNWQGIFGGYSSNFVQFSAGIMKRRICGKSSLRKTTLKTIWMIKSGQYSLYNKRKEMFHQLRSVVALSKELFSSIDISCGPQQSLWKTLEHIYLSLWYIKLRILKWRHRMFSVMVCRYHSMQKALSKVCEKPKNILT